MKRVRLRKPKRDHSRRDARYKQLDYTQSAPFFANPNGVLIHRIKSLYRLECDWGRSPWWIIEYWCGNHGRSENNVDDDLLFEPSQGRLVCARCESMAIASGEKSSSELVGRHVCVGVCRPVNVCCSNESN